MRNYFPMMLAGLLGLAALVSLPGTARAQQRIGPNPYYYYPYYYFPHSYWPAQSPAWPESKGSPYVRPPAYMAYPPFREPHWRYEWWQPQLYYRGFHFWLDQF